MTCCGGIGAYVLADVLAKDNILPSALARFSRCLLC